MIEEVERFGAEYEPGMFGNGYVLVDGGSHRNLFGPAQNAGLGVTEGSPCRNRERSEAVKGLLSDRFFAATGVAHKRSDLIRAGCQPGIGRTQRDRSGKAALCRDQTGDAEARKGFPHEQIGVTEEGE